MKLLLNEVLDKAMEEHRAGNISEADRLYTAILRKVPTHSDANHNLGVLALSTGKLSTAQKLIENAILARPEVLQFRLSYIDVLVKQKRNKDVNKVISDAINHGFSPENVNIIKNHAHQANTNFLSKKEKELDTQTFNELIELYQNSKIEVLISKCQSALKTYPPSAKILNILGAGLRAQGKVKAAIYNYRRALKVDPKFSDAYNNLGNALKDQGEFYAAIDNYSLALKYNEKHPDALQNMADVIRRVTFSKLNPEVEMHTLRLLSERTYARPKELARATISLLKLKPEVLNLLNLQEGQAVSQSTQQILIMLSNIPLLLKLMDVCPIPDLELERALTALRRMILTKIGSISLSGESLRIQSSLALQCFTNEYVYFEHHDETELVKKLENNISDKIDAGSIPSSSELACLASYRALNSYDWVSTVEPVKELKAIFERQVWEVDLETQLKPKIKQLGKIANEVSSKVQQQYEENPYPRWINLNLTRQPSSLSNIVKKSKLKLIDQLICDVETPSILIAGCGTGQHPIESATKYSNSTVLAIDLSLTSLAYAKRKTEGFGIKNLEFAQADILSLEQLQKKFDVIESVGVLHHMEDPVAGWRSLVNCLKSKGLMKIGLYSELARQDIVRTRAEIELKSFNLSSDNIRKFRRSLIKSAEPHHQSLFLSNDFYSLSNIRDLLFHVKEHRFDLKSLSKILRLLGLRFCGFEDARIVSVFKDSYPDDGSEYDLKTWERFEKDFPRIFAGMYQFWCQKVN